MRNSEELIYNLRAENQYEGTVLVTEALEAIEIERADNRYQALTAFCLTMCPKSRFASCIEKGFSCVDRDNFKRLL